jgi:hypothetical protein
LPLQLPFGLPFGLSFRLTVVARIAGIMPHAGAAPRRRGMEREMRLDARPPADA